MATDQTWLVSVCPQCGSPDIEVTAAINPNDVIFIDKREYARVVDEGVCHRVSLSCYNCELNDDVEEDFKHIEAPERADALRIARTQALNPEDVPS